MELEIGLKQTRSGLKLYCWKHIKYRKEFPPLRTLIIYSTELSNLPECIQLAAQGSCDN